MALQTPYLIAPVAFDASNAQEIEFTVPAGGDQVQSNKLTILKQSDLSEVYSQKVVTQDYTHTIPAGTLTNGVVYVASVKTYNLAGDESAESNKVLLRCYSTPSFNLSVDSTISTSQVNIVVEYAQAQNEPLATYLFNLYDSVGVLIATSKTQYAASDTNRITYQFTGLRSGQSYSVECLGVTKYGTQISTGSQTFFVQFTEPTAYKYFSLENVCKGGYIRIQSNLSSIPGETNKVPLEFGDGELTLYQNQWVKWNKGYVLPEDWTLQIWGHSFVSSDTTPIVTCANVGGDKVEVYWQEQVVKQPPLQWTWNATPTFPAQGTNLNWDIKFSANGAEYTKLNVQHDADGHKYIGYISSAGSTLAYDTGVWRVTSRDILFEENPSDDLLAVLKTMATTTQSETEKAYSYAVLKAWSAKAAYPYIIRSETIESASADTVHSVWVKKVGALYDIKIFNNQQSDTIFAFPEINTLQIDDVVSGKTTQADSYASDLMTNYVTQFNNVFSGVSKAYFVDADHVCDIPVFQTSDAKTFAGLKSAILRSVNSAEWSNNFHSSLFMEPQDYIKWYAEKQSSNNVVIGDKIRMPYVFGPAVTDGAPVTTAYYGRPRRSHKEICRRSQFAW